MKSIKQLIIASTLSMMAASCYADAGSFLPHTEQKKSVDISFAAPEHLTISLDQAPGLLAGMSPSGMDIAKLTVDSASIKEYGVRGVSSSVLDSYGVSWKITGKNSGKSIVVGFPSQSLSNSHGPEMWNGVGWYTFDTNTSLDIVTMADQDISPDTYPLTVDVVGYQP
ncbi:pilus assembly protein [Salmonella enterica]|uniref:Pilus assembly protein n=1 Tax=Salmonella enterica TaxID=28901 RepID=A0A745EWK3_SALER|nr:pilus assembly protein [Salmonella enterica]EBW8588197.1 pilus assembly protein [Salmonella enterica subsp. enterica serovar Senftenberg]EDP9382443.1 pilus assembly protein [Salmonella enterica subsp. enterica serovar Grumpensis]EAQ4956583.1 pilus assembly protein [Salmonella enterica]EAT0282587.1 pilus assembly protein [Salmonella enterica]